VATAAAREGQAILVTDATGAARNTFTTASACHRSAVLTGEDLGELILP
jgi:hypothetical protein